MYEEELSEFYKLLETISAKAGIGLAFARHPFDIERYTEIIGALNRICLLLSPKNTLSSIFSFLKEMPEIGDQEYITPKVAVATVAFNDNEEILLVRRKEGIWTLPGGYADIPLDPIQNATKEVLEETGLSVEIKSLIGVYDTNINKFPSIGRQVYSLVFYGVVHGGKIRPDLNEITDVEYFSLKSLPNTFSITLSQIEYGLRLHKGEILPALVEHHNDS